jgi:hypothetical protein
LPVDSLPSLPCALQDSCFLSKHSYPASVFKKLLAGRFDEVFIIVRDAVKIAFKLHGAEIDDIQNFYFGF